jgi:hypothetical protein
MPEPSTAPPVLTILVAKIPKSHDQKVIKNIFLRIGKVASVELEEDKANHKVNAARISFKSVKSSDEAKNFVSSIQAPNGFVKFMPMPKKNPEILWIIRGPPPPLYAAREFAIYVPWLPKVVERKAVETTFLRIGEVDTVEFNEHGKDGGRANAVSITFKSIRLTPEATAFVESIEDEEREQPVIFQPMPKKHPEKSWNVWSSKEVLRAVEKRNSKAYYRAQHPAPPPPPTSQEINVPEVVGYCHFSFLMTLILVSLFSLFAKAKVLFASIYSLDLYRFFLMPTPSGKGEGDVVIYLGKLFHGVADTTITKVFQKRIGVVRKVEYAPHPNPERADTYNVVLVYFSKIHDTKEAKRFVKSIIADQKGVDFVPYPDTAPDIYWRVGPKWEGFEIPAIHSVYVPPPLAPAKPIRTFIACDQRKTANSHKGSQAGRGKGGGDDSSSSCSCGTDSESDSESSSVESGSSSEDLIALNKIVITRISLHAKEQAYGRLSLLLPSSIATLERKCVGRWSDSLHPGCVTRTAVIAKGKGDFQAVVLPISSDGTIKTVLTPSMRGELGLRAERAARRAAKAEKHSRKKGGKKALRADRW